MPHTENQIENVQLVRDNKRKQLRFAFVTDFYGSDVYWHSHKETAKPPPPSPPAKQ